MNYVNLKEKAIFLRTQGLSYSEILEQIPVAKSTLSLWLRFVGLSKKQKQRLTEKKLLSSRRGADKKREMRIRLVDKIKKEAKNEIKKLINENFWLLGVILYWAEGSKGKEHNISQPVHFNNSDPRMVKIFIKWLKEVVKIPSDDIEFEIYIYQNADVEKALKMWSRIVSRERNRIKVYFKKHKIKRTNRKNTGKDYFGLMRVKVKRSSNLNRKISAWIDEICNYWGVV